MKIKMEIEDNGRHYRFIQGNQCECDECTKSRHKVQNMCSTCYEIRFNLDVFGYFERFHPVDELVRIGVRLLTRKLREMYEDYEFVCHGPKYPTDADNEIYLRCIRFGDKKKSKELEDLIERLSSLGLAIN